MPLSAVSGSQDRTVKIEHGPAHEFLALITYVQKPPLNACMYLARLEVKFWVSLHLHGYCA